MPRESTAMAEPANRRWFVGIGVGAYANPALNLENALADVGRMSDWFVEHPHVKHAVALADLSSNPTAHMMADGLRTFLDQCTADDVIALYLACHGEFEDGEAFLLAHDSPTSGFDGLALSANALGRMLGRSSAQNILIIVDTCVAGAVAAEIADAARKVVRERSSKDPYRTFALVILSSTYGLDPAIDGEFVRAFLKAVGDERWTGTVRPWIDIQQILQGINAELRAMGNGQNVENTLWSNGEIALIPNPNLRAVARQGTFDEAEFAAHFDPAARGVSRSEGGSFFTGRTQELRQMTNWLSLSEAATDASSMFVVTGSPGSGKSALLSRVAVLSQPDYWTQDLQPDLLPRDTVPQAGAVDGVVWCHGKTREQVITEIGTVLGGAAASTDALLGLARQQGRNRVIAVDALDEAAPGEAEAIASQILAPLAAQSPIRVMVATRRHSIEGDDLLAGLSTPRSELLDLDRAVDRKRDMADYVRSRIDALRLKLDNDAMDREAASDALAHAIADAAGNSFLVASIAVRSTSRLNPPSDAYVLPIAVGEALDTYIDRLVDPERVRTVLRPLAWALGSGQPWGTVWPALAEALSQSRETVPNEEIAATIEAACDLIVEADDHGEPVYRLFHQSLAEHIRTTTPDPATAPTRIARSLLALVEGRSWTAAPRYCRNNLPSLLTQAGLIDELAGVLLDPGWDLAQRDEAGLLRDSTRDVESAAALFAETERAADLAALCHQYSRGTTETLPPLIEVLARSGQQRRAELLAENLTDVADRMLTYRGLAGVFAQDGDIAAAGRCAAEVRRTLSAMPPEHLPMAWAWTCEAFAAARLQDAAVECALNAEIAVDANDEWDRLNGLFWAAMAARVVGDETLRSRVAARVEGLDVATFRNQALQAAAVAGCTDMLRALLEERLAVPRDGHHPVRVGNLALALADAAMFPELDRLVDYVGTHGPDGEDDSLKRWAWAMAISGRIGVAIDELERINERVERSKAIARLAPIIVASREATHIGRLLELAQQTMEWGEPRSIARLGRTLWLLGSREEALKIVEREIEAGARSSVMIDTRAEGIRSDIKSGNHTGGKYARRAMTSSRAPVVDEVISNDAIYEANIGNIEKAREKTQTIQVSRYKARAIEAIARQETDPALAMKDWFQALILARRAGRGEVEKLLPLGPELLRKAGDATRADDLMAAILDIDVRWQMELFADEYVANRHSMAPGRDRTRLFTNLMLLPEALSRARDWSPAEVRAAWERGDDGGRLFALGLMRGNPNLLQHDILVQAIRGSRSAFEAYTALKTVLDPLDTIPADESVLQAIREECSGVPRLDGTRAWLEEGSDRRLLAERILALSTLRD